MWKLDYSILTSQGDSGSFLGYGQNGHHYIVGVTSYGLTHCGGPTTYTRVAYFSNWISSTVNGYGK